MPDRGWQVLNKGQYGALLVKPNNSSTSLARATTSPPVHFHVKTARAGFQFKGPDNSPMTARALDIAEKMVQRCLFSPSPAVPPEVADRNTD